MWQAGVLLVVSLEAAVLVAMLSVRGYLYITESSDCKKDSVVVGKKEKKTRKKERRPPTWHLWPSKTDHAACMSVLDTAIKLCIRYVRLPVICLAFEFPLIILTHSIVGAVFFPIDDLVSRDGIIVAQALFSNISCVSVCVSVAIGLPIVGNDYKSCRK